MVKVLNDSVTVEVDCPNLECDYRHKYIRQRDGLLVATLPKRFSRKNIYDRMYYRTPEGETVEIPIQEQATCPKCDSKAWILEMNSTQAARLEDAYNEAQVYSFKDMYTKEELETREKDREARKTPRLNYLELDMAGYPEYEQLIGEINDTFDIGAYSGTIVLVRKLIENLIVSLLRANYGMANLDLFFIKSEQRFRNLSQLIKNLRDSIEDFKPFGLDNKIMRVIEKLREEGNARAHSIIDHGTKGELLNLRADVNKAVIALFSTWRNIS